MQTLLHCQQNFALWKFRSCEFSPWRNFASANFRYCEISQLRIFAPTKFRHNEISLQWMRNFAKMTAKFRLTSRKFSCALTKFRGEISSNFRENKERKTPNFVCISFAQYCTSPFGSRSAVRARKMAPSSWR